MGLGDAKKTAGSEMRSQKSLLEARLNWQARYIKSPNN